MNDVADVYERVLNRAEGIWVDASSWAKLEKRKALASRRGAAEGLHGPRPAEPALAAIDELSLFPTGRRRTAIRI